MTGEETQGIDVVITWVDGADPAWQRQLMQFRPAAGSAELDAAGPRFRDPGLLKFVLRSLDCHFPDLRKIWLVTSGQKPAWLNEAAGKISVVSHVDIFPQDSHLPTFNSMAIECHLHRIPSLSTPFLYFNDDVLLLAPLTVDRFAPGDGGHIVPLENFPMPSSLVQGEMVDRSLAYTGLLLRERFGHRHPDRLVAHGPQIYDPRWIDYLWDLWPTALARTSASRFRQTDCVAMRYLYYYTLLICPINQRPAFARSFSYPVEVMKSRDLRLILTRETPSLISKSMAEIEVSVPRFLCINDDEPDEASSRQKMKVLLDWLQVRFPQPSKWER